MALPVVRLSPDRYSAAEVVQLLRLEPLPHEGGYYRRTAEAAVDHPGSSPSRRAYSAIYALFTPDEFSALHRLNTDEVWCFHAGDPLESLRLSADERGEWVTLGLNLEAGERPQDVVPAGVWQGTRLVSGGRWALVSCLMTPEFRWEQFTLAEPAPLVAAYPEYAEAIRELCRAPSPL
ncbi:MAG TPA: cupin domain-containing protein [Candidatus Synoicihabitans sp.]|nr:cupin domain-containing protein [Candidatus Synoicihabitans sp.]